MRCAEDCALDRWPIPDAVPALAKGDAGHRRASRRCWFARGVAGWRGPHVLWFDESYDEPRFFLDTGPPARRGSATLLVVAGTSAQTNLPWQVVTLAARAGATIVDINVEDNPFGEIAADVGRRAPRTRRGRSCRRSSTH